MRPPTRSLALLGALLAAGCQTPTDWAEPGDTAVRAFAPRPAPTARPTPPPAQPRPTMAPRPGAATPPPSRTATPPPTTTTTPPPATATTPTPAPSEAAATTSGGQTPDTVVWSTGQFLGDGGDTDRWAFSLRAVQRPDGRIEDGQVIVASSIAGRNVTLFGEIKSGTITRNAQGGGTADLTATLTTGGSMHLVLTDANAVDAQDRVVFDAGARHCNGGVYHGAVRILRAQALEAGRTAAAGHRFDSRIGMFIVAGDLDAERACPESPCDPRVVEVTRPDPLIDFRKNDPGGYLHAPGSDNNVPN